MSKRSNPTITCILSIAVLSLVALHPGRASAQDEFPFVIVDNDFVLKNRDLVIRNSADRVLFRIDAQSGDLRIFDSDGETVVLIQRQGRNLTLGGSGRAGDLVLLPRSATTQDVANASVHLDGSDGSQRLGGGGTDGELVLRDAQGRQRILLSGATADLTLGQEGRDGDIAVRNAAGEATITLDGSSGRIRADRIVSTGNVRVEGKVSSSAFASNSPLILEAPAGTERARIDDATGNFGIGTGEVTPVERLHVMGGILIQDGGLDCVTSGAPVGSSAGCIHEDLLTFGVVPIGSIVAWHRNLPGVPDLSDDWAPCNGQVITEQDHPGSPLVNTRLPNLNGEGRFLRGDFISGGLQDDAVGPHMHPIETFTSGFNETRVNQGSSGAPRGRASTLFNPDEEPRGETRPVNMTVVWIMRVR